MPPITTPADEKKSEEKKPSEQAIPTAQENKADKGKAVAPEKPDDKAKPATQEKPDDKSKSTVSEKPAAQDKSGKRLFSVNGHLLPNYRMEQMQPDQNMLDDLMSCLTIDDLVGKEQPAKADGPLPKEPVSKTLTGPSDVPKAKSIRSADKNKKRGHSR